MPVQVLLVDDVPEVRIVIASFLKKDSRLKISSEASDGIEAVRKAEQLQPDLILLDIGLPCLNGLDAAHLIRKVSPQSKILFVSQESSAEIVQEVFRIGAHGYVVKADMMSDLLAAVDAVLRGDRFVGRRLADLVTEEHAEESPASLIRTLNSV
jgi:DNA-binding NarL/FixJ family response regulator